MARRAKSSLDPAGDGASPDERGPSDLRIIGGTFRGRKLRYHGRFATRPMKHRVREAIFNLVGPTIKGKHAIDLFAGTGAIGLESLSRGAASATFVERHIPTARLITENIVALDVEDRCQVASVDALLWPRRETPPADPPWVVFISPPYELYVSRLDEMVALVTRAVDLAPPESTIVVEADERFDFGKLSEAARWDVRTYRPAVVGILRNSAVDT